MNTEKKINALMRYIVAGSQEEKDNIVEEIKSMIEPIAKEKQTENIEDVISEIFVEIGMPCHIIGYQYSVYATKLVVENSDIINAVVRELYPAVAKKFNTTTSKVERAIRHCVECTWDRSDIDVIKKYFGNTVSSEKGKPTNSEFIARIANIVRRRIRNG